MTAQRRIVEHLYEPDAPLKEEMVLAPADLDQDRDEVRLAGLTAWARREADLLDALLPVAVSAQWTAAPTVRPREDTAERSKNVRSDPTSAIALDSERLALRRQVVRSEHALRCAIVALRGVRIGLVRALAPWQDGEARNND